jgi:dCMP deaminase
MKRPTWDEYFLNICKAVATRSIDENTKIGCVVVDNRNRIVATGYNSFPPGVNDDKYPKDRVSTILIDGERVNKYDIMSHAEASALIHASGDLSKCTLYVGTMPCHECCKLIIHSGIKRVVIGDVEIHGGWKRSFVISSELFKDSGVEVVGKIKLRGGI